MTNRRIAKYIVTALIAVGAAVPAFLSPAAARPAAAPSVHAPSLNSVTPDVFQPPYHAVIRSISVP